MPIVIERKGEIKRSRLDRIYGMPKNARVKSSEEAVDEVESSSSSSIGENSGSFGSNGSDLAGEEKEVESAFKPLDGLDSLEEALPIRRGISNFYRGKSKSFTSLSEAVSFPSIKDISKQDDAYTRKRRSLIASSNLNSNSFKKSSNNKWNNSSNNKEDRDQKRHLLPPLHPAAKNDDNLSSMVQSESPQYCSFAMRSFSMADLYGVADNYASTRSKEELPTSVVGSVSKTLTRATFDEVLVVCKIEEQSFGVGKLMNLRKTSNCDFSL